MFRQRPARDRRAALVPLFLVILGTRATSGEPARKAPLAPVVFSRDILPILSENCFQCHGPDAKARKAGLRLDTQGGALRKDDPVILPRQSGESELALRVASADPADVMPPPGSNRTLTARQVGLLKQWIDEGAGWGRHWSFEPVRRQVPPDVRDAGWPRNPVDRFVLAGIEAEGLSPSPEAERATQIRRLTLDLIGLPPTPAEVDAFLGDVAPDAYGRLVDRLLASPSYGERMAWDWLDAARYADSNGYQGDADRTMWPWRDWVIDALNRGLPFDRFTAWQLAGDLLPAATAEQKLATGFNRNHMINGEGGRIAEENRVDYVMDMAETAGTVWLGLTFNCCRCHDHKFDPITQRDYYGLFAFFNRTPVNGGGGDPQTPPVVEAPGPDQKSRREALAAAVVRAAARVSEAENASPPRRAVGPEVAKILEVPAGRRSRAQIERLEKQWQATEPEYAGRLAAHRLAVDALDGLNRSVPRVMVMEDMPAPRDTYVLTRGSYEKPAEKVVAAVPAALPPLPPDAPRDRLGLARWLVAPENPLAARVAVNRAWQQFFGEGLVTTPEDFGVQGVRPSHPELLDWLASEFVGTGWDVKALHRLVVTSATYRQSSRVRAGLAERDPRNRLLARGPRSRLPAWMIRDQALAASGLLVRATGGAPVYPYQPAGVWEEATFGNRRYQQDHGAALYRRSLYTFWRRIIGPTGFFDSAPRQTCVVKPVRTNTPLHALTTLNDVTYVEAARALAGRVLGSAGPSPGERVEMAFRRVLARKPDAAERAVLVASVERVRGEFASDREAARKWLDVGESARDGRLDPVEHAAYAALCSAIFNLDEALTKE